MVIPKGVSGEKPGSLSAGQWPKRISGKTMEVDMSINVTGRQFEITPAIRQHVEDALSVLLNDTTLKVTSINVVMERGKNQFTSSIVLNCKYHVLPAKVEDFDLYKSFDQAVGKIEAQVDVLKAKIHDHKAEPLSSCEARKAAETPAE